MRYIVEIDSNTDKGAELLKYIAQLNASHDEVKVHQDAELSDEEMALPGQAPTPKQLEDWLSKPDYGYVDGQDALVLLKEGLAAYRKSKE